MDYEDDNINWIPFLDEDDPFPGQVSPYATSSHTTIFIFFELLDSPPDSSKDTVMDLGCGDGRILIWAAKKFGVKGVGMDINPSLVEKAIVTAREEGVSHLCDFKVQSFLDDECDFTKLAPTIITTYLTPKALRLLEPKLRGYAKFTMKEWGWVPKLLTNVFRFEDPWKPIKISPAMNVFMYDLIDPYQTGPDPEKDKFLEATVKRGGDDTGFLPAF
eukprot:TRINITY_DN12419_c0_g1_i1.p1 TRINITY_DN12419_c0_g1~~TRINITY_DN12419_c0_g1_i1.p1  ORF type:complete len:217 (-),score=47.19 TRINITY_DN12419_c0_g1_i1:177-827(-)